MRGSLLCGLNNKISKTIILPSADLKPYIVHYLFLDIQLDASSVGVYCSFPSGCCVMNIFYSADLPAFHYPDKTLTNIRCFVSGYLKQGVKLGKAGHHKCVIVQFTPSGAFHIFGIPPSEYTNTFIPLNDLIGKKGEEIAEKIYEQNFLQIINHLNCYFRELVYKNEVGTMFYEQIMYSIIRHHGNIRISSLLKEFNITQRQLDRCFDKLLGIAPKEYAWLVRLNTAYNMLLFDKQRSITDITYSLGYFDQTHMLKDFARYSDITPGDFRRDTNKTLFQPILFAEHKEKLKAIG